MKRINTLIVVLLSSLVLGACSNASSDNSSNNTSTQSTSNSDSSNHTGGEGTFLNKSYKVELQGETWNTALASTNQIFESDGSKYSEKVQLLKNYLNTDNSGDSGLISSLSGAFVYNGTYLEDKINALQLGNGNSSMGELTLNFAYPISKIEVKVEGYSKPYTDYKTGTKVANADSYSILAIGTSETPKMKVLDMSVTNPDKASLPVTLTSSVEFNSGITSLTFKGIGDESFSDGAFAAGRVMFHYINFFY